MARSAARLSDADRYPLKLRNLLVTALDRRCGPERVVWASNPENVISDLPNVGINPDRLYRPVALPNIGYLPYTGRVMAIDPSGRGKDETAYAVVNILHGMLFLMDAGGFSDGYGDGTLAALAAVAKEFEVNKIVVESNFGDGMFTKLFTGVLRNVWPCAIEEVRHGTQKERRICDTLEPVPASHRLVVHAGLVRKDYESTRHLPAEVAHRYQLFYQLTRLTRERGALAQDDRVEAVAIAVAYWSAQLVADVDKQVQASRDRAGDQALREFARHALGRKPAGRVWAGRV